MDKLIAATQFVHNDTSKREKFIGALEEINRNSDTGTVQDVLKALTALEKKLTEKAQPIHETEGWKHAMGTFEEVETFSRNILYRNEKIKQDIQAGFFSFIVHLLQNGLTMLHMNISYDCLNARSFELKDYIRKLNEESLKPLILAVCKNVHLEQGIDGEEFGAMYERLVECLIENTLEKEQRKQFTDQLLDLTIICILDCHHFQEKAYRRISDTGKSIMNVLDDPFKHTNDFSRIKSIMKKCGDIIIQPTFPSSEVSARVISNFIGNFISQLGKRALVAELYGEIFDLILNATKCPYHNDKYDIYLFESAYGFFRSIPSKTLTKNAELFKGMAKRYCDIIDGLDMRYLSERFADTVLCDGLQKVYADNKEVGRLWLELLIPLFKKPCRDTMRACYTITCNSKGYNWKDHKDLACQVVDLIVEYQPPDDTHMNEEEKKSLKDFLENFKSAVEYFFDGLKKSRMLKDFGKCMAALSLKFLESRNTVLLELSEAIAERTELNPKEDKEFMVDLMKKFHVILKNEDHLWNESWPLQRAACDLIESCMKPFKDGRVFTDDELGVFVSICLTCLDHDCVNPETQQWPSHYYSVFLSVINVLSKWLVALNKVNLAADLLPKYLKCMESEDANAVLLSAVQIYTFSQASSGQKVAAPYLDQLIQIYFDKRQDQLLHTISEIYPSNPKALKNHFPSLMDLLEETMETTVITYLGMLFQKVSKKQAEVYVLFKMPKTLDP